MPRQNLAITGMTVITVRLPVRSKRSQGSGDVAGSVRNVLLRLETDAGIVGWGEASPWAAFTGTAEAAAGALHVHFRPFLMGADPLRIQTLMHKAERTAVGAPEARAALETALWDIAGKACGKPLAELLGGRVRDSIPLSFSIANPDLDADIAMAARLHAEGIRLFKVKTGFAGHREDMRRLDRLRAALPADIDLRVDYNQGLEAWNALPQLREVERFAPTFIEQPVPAHQVEALAEIAGALDTPVMADESVFTPADALRLVGLRAAGLVSVKIMKSGGILRAREVASICEAAGIACYGGSMFETGIAAAAGAHMIGATANISLGCEFYQATYYLEEDLLAEPYPVSDGAVHVPTGPGLGVTVDEDRVRKYTEERLA